MWRCCRDAIARAYEAGETNYPPSDGVAALRTAVAGFYRRRLGLSYPTASILVAGGGGKIKTGLHTKSHNTIGDVYKTITEEVFHVDVNFPTAEEKMGWLV